VSPIGSTWVTVGVTSAAEATEAAITITNFIVSLLFSATRRVRVWGFEGINRRVAPVGYD
jgi:hypothetical protein